MQNICFDFERQAIELPSTQRFTDLNKLNLVMAAWS